MLAASLGRLRWESDATLSAEQRLPVSVWTYGFDDDGVRHLGPMAQDFAAAFGLGDDDRVIDMVDANGVVMAASRRSTGGWSRSKRRCLRFGGRFTNRPGGGGTAR